MRFSKLHRQATASVRYIFFFKEKKKYQRFMLELLAIITMDKAFTASTGNIIYDKYEIPACKSIQRLEEF